MFSSSISSLSEVAEGEPNGCQEEIFFFVVNFFDVFDYLVVNVSKSIWIHTQF